MARGDRGDIAAKVALIVSVAAGPIHRDNKIIEEPCEVRLQSTPIAGFDFSMGDMTGMKSQIDAATLQAISAFMERIKCAYSVSSARLYGSRARGDHGKHSDADIAVFLKGERAAKGDLLRTKLEMAGIAFDVLLDTNILISPLPIWEDDWRQPERYENPRLLENTRREGVTL